MDLRTWITLAAAAGLLGLWLQRRDRQPRPAGTPARRLGTDTDTDANAHSDASAAANAHAVASHAPANTMSPALDHAAGLSRGPGANLADLTAPAADAGRAQRTEPASSAHQGGVALESNQQR